MEENHDNQQYISPERQLNLPFTDQLRRALSQHEDKNIDELFPQLETQIGTLDVSEYIHLLDLVDSGLAPDLTEWLYTHLDIVVNRFGKDLRILLAKPEKTDNDYQQIRTIAEKTKSLIQFIPVQEAEKMDPVLLQKMYAYINDPTPYIRQQAAQYVPHVIALDTWKRNTTPTSTLSLEERFKRDVAFKLTDGVHPDENTALTLLEQARTDGAGYLIDTLHECLKQIPEGNKEIATRVFRPFANLIGQERTLELLAQIKSEDPEVTPKIYLIESFFTSDDANLYDAGTVYNDHLKMDEWEASLKDIEKDLEVIAQELPGAHTLLDIACGVGIHMQKLREQGKEVTGLDLSERNVRQARHNNPDARIDQIGWDKLPYSDDSFDAGYCMGRSAGHNFTVDEWIKLLSEAHRVIKGRFILSSSGNEYGHVGDRRETYAEVSEGLGVSNTESGAYIGDFDKGKFTYRLVPSDEQFRAMAFIAGYEVVKRIDQPYTDHKGRENFNYYYVLEKRDKKATLEEVFDATRKAYTGSQPLRLSI